MHLCRAASEEDERPGKKAKGEDKRSFEGQNIPSNQPLLLSGGTLVTPPILQLILVRQDSEDTSAVNPEWSIPDPAPIFK